HWYAYSRARDMMLEATDTKVAPWYIVRSDDKRRARLNCIAHLLHLLPYEDVPQDKVKLPARSDKGQYDDQPTLNGRSFVSETYLERKHSAFLSASHACRQLLNRVGHPCDSVRAPDAVAQD